MDCTGWKTYAKVALTSPSMKIAGLAPKVASHNSDTNEPHMFIIDFGEHFMSTTPTCSEGSFGEVRA